MKKQYIQPASMAVSLHTGQMLAGSIGVYDDAEGVGAGSSFSNRREPFGPDSPWNETEEQ